MNKTTKYRTLLALGIGLLFLLPTLAALQYHWLTQLSRSENVRMQANVDAAVRHLVEDIRQEIELATRIFMFRGVSPATEVASELASRHEKWNAMAAYPDMLEAAYWVEMRADESDLRLHRFLPERRVLEPTAWDGGVDSWRLNWLESMHGRASRADAPDVRAQPVLTLPVMRASADQQTEGERLIFRGRLPIAGVVLLELNQQRMVNTILPALVRTYFTHDSRRDYDVLILDRDDSSAVLYGTSPELTRAEFERPDASASFIFPEGPSLMAVMDSVPSAYLEAHAPSLAVRRDQSDGVTRLRREAAADGQIASADPFPTQWRPSRTWQVLVKHKDGSLEQAVAHARLRNVAVSFGVLLVLGSAILLIVFYARQMHHLAEQQMTFVAGVSHELRTPIAVVQAAGENLQDGLIEDPGEARDYGKLIVKESRRLLDMVEQVLAFSGIAFLNEPSVDAEVHVEQLVVDALETLRPLIVEKDATVEQRIETGLPPVRGDAATLSAAVVNLLQNALKYGGNKPWIGVSARMVAIGQDSEIHLTVTDCGEGIASGEQIRIFDPFYRTQRAVKSGIRGNGLGLSIVKKVVEAHGGRVEVRSTPGKGSRFTIRLSPPAGHTKALQ